MNDKDCIICYDKCNKKRDNINFIVNCSCKMNYHKKCIEKWLNIKNRCPICREVWQTYDDNDDDNDITRYILCCCTVNVIYLIIVIFIV
jgi:hypothetical protein